MKDEAGAAIQRAAERLRAPVLTTYKAKGVIDETHPLSLYGHGLSPLSDGVALPLLKGADCVISIGYDPIEMRAGWIAPFAPERHIELAHAAILHGMHGAAHQFVGDVAASLDALLVGVEAKAETWPGAEPAAARTKLDALFGDRTEWGAHQAFAAAARACPADATATVDSGAHRILMSQMWRCRRPRQLLQSSAFCTMGAALPLAIGAKLADPSRPVLAVMGDAGLEMVMGELATLRDRKLRLPILVLVDESLGLIELKQRKSGFDTLGVDFPGTDFVALAEAMGGRGAWIRDAAGLERALAEAFAAETFSIVAAVIGGKAYDGAF